MGIGGEATAAAFQPPPGLEWHSVSSRLGWYRKIQVVGFGVVVVVAGAALAARVLPAGGALLAVCVLIAALLVGWLVTELNWRSWGYVEASDELLLTHGVIWRRLIVVPYRRLQFVDITANTVQQWLGIGTIRLYTAAATTQARIPGVPLADAVSLRARLARAGVARSAGR